MKDNIYNQDPEQVEKEILQLKIKIKQIIFEQEKIAVELESVKKGLEKVTVDQKELEGIFMKEIQSNHDIHLENNKMISTLLNIVVSESQTNERIKIRTLDLKEKVLIGVFGTGGLAGIIVAIFSIFNR